MAAGLGLALGACSRPPAIAYLEHRPKGVEHTRDLNRPFDETWRVLVGKLSNGFFIVNRSEKTARLIDLSFTAADPEAYVDCGYLMVDAVLPSGARERTPIPVAEDMQFALYRQSSTTMAVDRQTVLHGRAAVFVDLAGGGTRVSVNIKYALVVKSTYQGYNVLKAPTGAPGRETQVTRFDSNKPSKGLPNGHKVTCYSRGVLEQTILDAAT